MITIQPSQFTGIHNITRVTTTPYNILSTDEILFVDTDSQALTVNLPPGVSGKYYKVVNTGSSGNDATINPDGTEQFFQGGAGISFDLMDGEILDMHYDSTEGWY